MDVPGAGTKKAEESQATKAEGVLAKAAACWRSHTSAWIGLIILLLAVVGEILLYVIPGQYYVQSPAGDVFYGHYQLLNSLHALTNAGTYLGAFWVGGYFAFWGLRKLKA